MLYCPLAPLPGPVFLCGLIFFFLGDAAWRLNKKIKIKKSSPPKPCFPHAALTGKPPPETEDKLPQIKPGPPFCCHLFLDSLPYFHPSPDSCSSLPNYFALAILYLYARDCLLSTRRLATTTTTITTTTPLRLLFPLIRRKTQHHRRNGNGYRNNHPRRPGCFLDH